jgi:triosephosphate isomerase
MSASSALTLGVSLKVYFGAEETFEWCRQVAEMARRHEAVVNVRRTFLSCPQCRLSPR